MGAGGGTGTVRANGEHSNLNSSGMTPQKRPHAGAMMSPGPNLVRGGGGNSPRGGVKRVRMVSPKTGAADVLPPPPSPRRL